MLKFVEIYARNMLKYKNNFLEKVLKEREDCEKWKKADQADLRLYYE